jgi:hypothetical protein
MWAAMLNHPEGRLRPAGRQLVLEALHAVAEGGAVAWVDEAPSETAAASVPLLCGERRMSSVAGATRRNLDDLLSLLRRHRPSRRSR